MLHKSENNMSKTIKITVSMAFAISVLAISSFRVNEHTSLIIDENISFLDTKTIIPNSSPIKKENITTFSSGFGMRVHPIEKTKKLHSGIDIIAKKGTPILATADGVIVTSTYSELYGNYVIIKHSNTFNTLYAHMNNVFVKEGDKVINGYEIGIIGSSGSSLGIHLHYEVIKNEKKINPIDYLGEV